MRKKLLLASLMLIAVVALVRIPKIQAQNPVVRISNVYNITEPGMTFKVNITITGVTDLFMWVMNMSWDPSIIRITTGDPNGLRYPRNTGTYYNIYQGPFLKSIRSTMFMVSQVDNTRGKIMNLNCGYTTAGTAPNGDGILAIINFTSVAVGTTTIDINGPSVTYLGHSVMLDHFGSEMPHEDVDGTIYPTPPPVPTDWTLYIFAALAAGAVGAVVVSAKVYVTVKNKPVRQTAKSESPKTHAAH